MREFVRNGRKCQLLVRPGARQVNCQGPAEGELIRKWIRQGQQCSTYGHGLHRWTRCKWGSNFPDARIVRQFRRNDQKCTTWESGKQQKTVCWNLRGKVVKRFLRNGKQCAIWRRAGKQWVRCAKAGVSGARIVRRFKRQGQSCITLAKGENLWTKCKWTGDMAGASFVRRYFKDGQRCSVYRLEDKEKTVCWSTKQIVLKKFKRNGRDCKQILSAGRKWVSCSKPWKFGPNTNFNF